MSQKLKTTYQETIVPKLKEQFGYTNIHQVPKVTYLAKESLMLSIKGPSIGKT